MHSYIDGGRLWNLKAFLHRNRLGHRVAFLLGNLIALLYRGGRMNLLRNVFAFLHWLADAFLLLLVTVANIFAGLLIRSGTFLKSQH